MLDGFPAEAGTVNETVGADFVLEMAGDENAKECEVASEKVVVGSVYERQEYYV